MSDDKRSNRPRSPEQENGLAQSLEHQRRTHAKAVPDEALLVELERDLRAVIAFGVAYSESAEEKLVSEEQFYKEVKKRSREIYSVAELESIPVISTLPALPLPDDEEDDEDVET